MNGLEPRTIDHNASSIGAILTGNPGTGRPYKREKCVKCGDRLAETVLRTCGICHRHELFAAQPTDQQEAWIGTVVPPLFMHAWLTDLPDGWRKEIESLPEERGLCLWGPPGIGKTHTMAATARKYIGEGYLVQRIGFEMLCLKIRDTYKPASKETELGVIEPLIQADKLIIEDVGTTVSIDRQETDFSLRTFLVLLDQRLESRLSTFITTNKAVEQLRRSFDARVASRLVQACEIVKLTGKDKRTNRQAGLHGG